MNLTRRIVPLVFSMALVLGVVSSTARAQEPATPAGGEENNGRSLDGYFATGIMSGLALFLVAKSARRS